MVKVTDVIMRHETGHGKVHVKNNTVIDTQTADILNTLDKALMRHCPVSFLILCARVEPALDQMYLMTAFGDFR